MRIAEPAKHSLGGCEIRQGSEVFGFSHVKLGLIGNEN